LVSKLNSNPDDPVPCDVITTCPVCLGRMELVYDRYHQKVCVCADCGTGVSVPAMAWRIAKVKRELA
jgi:hypothetical protein